MTEKETECNGRKRKRRLGRIFRRASSSSQMLDMFLCSYGFVCTGRLFNDRFSFQPQLPFFNHFFVSKKGLGTRYFSIKRSPVQVQGLIDEQFFRCDFNETGNRENPERPTSNAQTLFICIINLALSLFAVLLMLLPRCFLTILIAISHDSASSASFQGLTL